MIGMHEKQNESWAEPVNLSQRIPADHPAHADRDRQPGDRLNIEFDMLAKYTEKLIIGGKNS
jgi:riboflavin synthase alpha subunit